MVERHEEFSKSFGDDVCEIPYLRDGVTAATVGHKPHTVSSNIFGEFSSHAVDKKEDDEVVRRVAGILWLLGVFVVAIDPALAFVTPQHKKLS